MTRPALCSPTTEVHCLEVTPPLSRLQTDSRRSAEGTQGFAPARQVDFFPWGVPKLILETLSTSRSKASRTVRGSSSPPHALHPPIKGSRLTGRATHLLLDRPHLHPFTHPPGEGGALSKVKLKPSLTTYQAPNHN